MRFLVALLVMMGVARAEPTARQLLVLGGGVSKLPGAAVDLNFTAGTLYPASSRITETRNSVATEDDLTGTWTTFPALTFRRTNKGHLHEEPRTNSVPNSAATGGGVGVLPTGWQASAGNGVSCSSTAVGVENGIPYDQITCSGTTSATTNVVIVFVPNNVTIAAAQNQVWSSSGFFKLTQGSFGTPSTAPTLLINEYNSGGGFLAQGGSGTFMPTGSSLGIQRQQFSYLVSNANTAFISTFFQVQYPTSTVVNFTVEVGWPQLELNPYATTAAQGFATSPIPTTSGAVARAEDNATMPLPAGACNAAGCSLWATATFLAPVAFTVNQVLATVSDGTNNNLSLLYRSAGAGLPLGQSIKASALAQIAAAGTVNPATLAKLSDYVTASTLFAVFNNGSAASVASTGVPSVSTLLLGSTVAGAAPCNCYVGRIAVAPTSLLGN